MSFSCEFFGHQPLLKEPLVIEGTTHAHSKPVYGSAPEYELAYEEVPEKLSYLGLQVCRNCKAVYAIELTREEVCN